MKWEGWNAYGYRDIHGISYEETALGSQLSCKACKERGGKDDEGEKLHHCFSMMNAVVWEKLQLWEIPRKFSKCTCKRKKNISISVFRRDPFLFQAVCSNPGSFLYDC